MNLTAAEFEQVFELVKLLIEAFIKPSSKQSTGEQSSEVIDKILQLMLCILDGLYSCTNVGALAVLSMQWVPVFEMRNERYLGLLCESVIYISTT